MVLEIHEKRNKHSLRQCSVNIPLKTSENLWFSHVFKEYRDGTLA